MQTVIIRCEYVWTSAQNPGQLHSKTRVVTFKTEDPSNWNIKLEDIPAWSFDGSKTGHATTDDAVRLLRPIFASIDPNRKNSILVLCDVLNTDFTPHESNYRSHLIDSVLSNASQVPLVGFGQEIRFDIPDESNRVAYYAQVGDRPSKHREIMEGHLNSCISTGISIDSSFSEDEPNKWQFQIGGPDLNPVQACDHLCVARFILMRMSENLDIHTIFSYNDSLNITISTLEMREAKDSALILSLAEKICSPSYKFVVSSVYGRIKDHLQLDRFSYTASDAEVLLPWSVMTVGSGYLEDTRPHSGSDPYLVTKALLDSICGELK